MKNLVAFLGIVSLVAFTGAVGAKEAETLDVSSTGSVQVKTSNTGAGAGASANTSVSSKSEFENETETESEKSNDDSVFQNNESDIDFASRSSNQSTTSVSVGVRAIEVRGWDPKQKEEFLLQLKERVELTSGQDLENFARGVLLQDENMESATVSEDNIEVEYRQPVKFLGIFATTIKTNVSVSSDAKVKVKFPWYRVFFYVPEELTELSIEADLQESIEVTAENSIQVQAGKFQTISNVLKTKHDTAKNSIGNIR
ncbi:MAG: hypothetical protein U1D31_00350 [Patescibacteria group bacterium]|nr:hypothetical protein [bacterium]MDZ4240571.1 hypothetical protein [Patescibacteria group bacterium]